MNPAIVIGGGGANGLGIARNLGRRGIPVYCVTSDPHDLMLFSRFCMGATIHPGIESTPPLLHTVLQRLQPYLPAPAVVFPTTDTAVLSTTAIRDRLAPHMAALPDPTTAETLVIKSNFYRSLQTHGVPHPRTLDPAEASPAEIAHTLGFPLFLRPAQSLLFHERLGGKGFVAHTLRDLRGYLRVARQHSLRVLAQEIIPGPTTNGYTIWGTLDHASRLNVRIVTQKLRQPRTFANACVIVSVPPERVSAFEPILLNYLQALHYRGLFGAEFKRDPRDGQFKLLEINARSMSGNEMALAVGANHVLATYYDALGEPMPPQLTYTPNIHLIDSLGDLATLLNWGVHGRLHPQDLAPYRQRVHWYIHARDDPLPFLKAVFGTLPALSRAFR